jgi:hypothetical protein
MSDKRRTDRQTNIITDPSGHAVYGMGLGCSNTGIVGSVPTQGIDVCPYVLYCPVQVERPFDGPTASYKESYQVPKKGYKI